MNEKKISFLCGFIPFEQKSSGLGETVNRLFKVPKHTGRIQLKKHWKKPGNPFEETVCDKEDQVEKIYLRDPFTKTSKGKTHFEFKLNIFYFSVAGKTVN